MNKAHGFGFGNTDEYFNRNLYTLLLFYKQLIQLLEIFFSGPLIITDDEFNRNYLRLCVKICEILEKPGFENLSKYEWRPFDNLKALDPDVPEGDWLYRGQQICGDFLSAIEEVFIANGEKTFPLSDEDKQLLSSIRDYLEKYQIYKNNYVKKWLKEIEKFAEKWKNSQETQMEIPEFNFEFIRDTEVKKLLIKDWKEAKEAFHNKLYKSTIILCGAVLEALLIDALSYIKEDAEFSYYQKYLEHKNKKDKPPKIENWKLYQLIEISKQEGIVTADVAKISNIVKDYRNLIHLWAQKRKKLRVNSNIANAVVNLLIIAYNDINNWHIRRK